MTQTTQNELKKHLSDPYNRMCYCYEFLKEADEQMYSATLRRIYYFLSIVSDSEAHY